MRALCPKAGAVITAVAMADFTATPTGDTAPSSPAPAVSWDGTYRGTVRITGLGSEVQRQRCETAPQIVCRMANNAFSYAMSHTNAP